MDILNIIFPAMPRREFQNAVVVHYCIQMWNYNFINNKTITFVEFENAIDFTKVENIMKLYQN